MQPVAETHALYNRWRDSLGICHRFVGRHIVGQIIFVDAPERPQERPQTSARTFTTIAVDFAYAIAVIITRPFLHTMAHTRVLRMHIRIVRCLIGVQDRTLWRHIPFHNYARSRLVGVLEYPIAHLVRCATDQTQDRWSIIVVGAFALLFIGASARRVYRM